jgi:hypothetical protein
MYELKGFYEIPSYINNSADQVALLGEISDDSLTYAKDKTIHTGSSAPNVGLISFHSVRDDLVVPVEGNYLDQVLKIGQYLYTQAQAGVINSNPNTLRQLVMAEFAGVLNSFSSGQMLNNGFVWLPEFIEISLIGSGEANRVIIWIADNSFRAQYDGYVIEIVQPLIPVDDFFKDPLIVRELLKNYNITEKLEEAQATRAQYPYTYLKAFDFDYVNPANTTLRYKATWLVIIYGEAGNNADIIKDAIVKDILDKSTHPREDWEVILPDLFLTTEFIITPLWNRYSVPNAQFQAGLHSPVFDPSTDLPLIKRTARGPAYSDIFVGNNYQSSVNIYKSLAFGSIGNPQNRNGVIKLTQQYPQYVVAETGSGDANRIDPETLEWMILFSTLIKAAETMTLYTSVPRGVSRMKRDDIVYASAFFKNVNYLVVTKFSVNAVA